MKAQVFKGEIIFVWLLLPFLAGIVSGFFIDSWWVLNYLLGVCSLLLTVLLSLYLGYVRFKIYFKRWLPGLLINAILFSFACCLTISQNTYLQPKHFSKIKGKALVVTISGEPKLSGDILRFETSVDAVVASTKTEPAVGKLLVALKITGSEVLFYGDKLLIPYKVVEVAPPYNPFEFNYKAYLANLDIHHQCFINTGQIKRISSNNGNWMVAKAYQIRREMVAGFSAYIPNKESAALASTLILGYKADLSPEILTAYSATGTMHVLSVSGMHVILVFEILAFMLSFLGKSEKAKIARVVFIILAIWFYALLTGFSSAACRAALMCSIFVIAKSFRKYTNPYNTVAASAFLLLFYNPYFLANAGFQLSYIAVLGLIYLSSKIRNAVPIPRKHKILTLLWNMSSATLAAQIATVPLSLYYFHQFPLYFLLGNLFIALPSAAIMYTGIGFLLLFSCRNFLPSAVLHLLGEFLSKTIFYMNKGLIAIENLSYSTLQVFPYSSWFFALLFVAILLLAVACQYQHKIALRNALLLFLCLAVFSSYRNVKQSQENKVVFYTLRRTGAIAFFEGRKASLLADFDEKDKTFAFFIKPSISAWADSVDFLRTKDSSLCYRNNFIRFHNWTMLIADSSMAKCSFHRSIAVKAVLIRNNPHLHVHNLLRSVKFSTLLIDGTNRDYRIKQWTEEARELHLKCYVLKGQPAYVIDPDS